MFQRNRLLLTVALVGLILMSWSIPTSAGYYDGKTITLLIPVPGGSGLDVSARTFAQIWQKRIPGNPTIIPKNMPGAGGAQALNFLYERAKPDGLTICWGPWNAAGILSKQAGLRYVPEKFAYIGAAGAYQTTIIRTDVPPGLKKPADIVKAETFNVGGRRADRHLDLIGNMAFEMIGAKYRFIGGFKGMAKIAPAIQRNEVQAGNSGHTGYHIFFKDTMIKTGKAIALWYQPNFDINGNPEKSSGAFAPNVRSFIEVYEEVHGKKPSGAMFEAYRWYLTVVSSMSHNVFGAPGSPNEAVEELRKSYQATAKDPAYLKPIEERYGAAMRFLSTEQGLKIMGSYRNVSSEIFATLDKMSKIGRSAK